jgi:hypothetical protein
LVSKGMFYGVVVVFVALLLITSTLAAVYYADYQQELSADQRHQDELSLSISSYNALLVLYNAGLNDYNQTLSLLAGAVSNLNTSTPAYRTAASDLASLWSSYQVLAHGDGQKPLVYRVSMLVDYGNGTARWYNDSATQPGWNAYVATLVLLDGNLQATWYPQFGEHFVTGVNGVNQTAAKSWFIWDFTGGKWIPSSSGSDYLPVDNGTTFAWKLCGYDANFSPTCAL